VHLVPIKLENVGIAVRDLDATIAFGLILRSPSATPSYAAASNAGEAYRICRSIDIGFTGCK
jgi:hypothetical protein